MNCSFLRCSFNELSQFVHKNGGSVHSASGRGNNCWYYASMFFCGAKFPLDNIEQYDDDVKSIREVIDLPESASASEEHFRSAPDLIGVRNVAVLTDEVGGVAMMGTHDDDVEHIAILSINHYYMIDLANSPDLNCGNFFKKVDECF